MNWLSIMGLDRLKGREVAKGLGVLSLLAILMLWLAGAFLDKVEPGPPSSKGPPPSYRTWKIVRHVYPLTIDQVGTIRSQSEAKVSSRVMAQVKEISVKEGASVIGENDKVSEPTILAVLDDREIKARLEQAQAQVDSLSRALDATKAKLGVAKAQVEAARANRDRAMADYRRYEDLHRHQAATGQQLEQARAQRDVTEAGLLAAIRDVQATESEIMRVEAQRQQALAAAAEARIMLSYTVIRAPFTGKVIKKMIDVGDMATPGQPLFVLEVPSRIELHSYISESLIPYLEVGRKMDVFIDALQQTFQGELTEMVPKADPATRTVLVKVALPPDSSFVNGQFGRLLVPYGKYDTMVLPGTAVRQVGQLSLVDVLGSDGHAQRRFVTLGKLHGDLVEVLSGVEEGEEVILP